MTSQWIRWSDWLLFLVPVTGNFLVRESGYIGYLLRLIREVKEIAKGDPIPAFFVVLRHTPLPTVSPARGTVLFEPMSLRKV